MTVPPAPFRRRSAAWRVVVPALLALAAPAPLAAQTAECDRLHEAIQSAARGRSGGERWALAATRQQAEIDRTQSYADQLGCGRGLFGLGDAAPCGGLRDRLDRMRDNLASLRDRAGQGGAESRAALVARYNDICVGLGGDLRGGDGAFDGGAPDPRQDNADPDASLAPPGPDDGLASDNGGRSLGQAICVRTCDGGWFPFGFTVAEGQLDGLQQLCQASCPNTEAKAYAMPREGTLGDAVAADGANYTALPAAFAFEKSFTPACTCKPPHQSWTDALAKAEALIGDPDRHDIVVTSAISDQMAKPGAVPVIAGKSKPPRKGKAAPAQNSDGDLASAATRDAQKASQAPTGSNALSGIGGPDKPERMVRQGEGERVTVAGPDGAKRTLRLIVP